VGRAELLCALFTWLSFLLYNRAIRARTSPRAWLAMSAFAVCATAAMLCKETGITAIVSTRLSPLVFHQDQENQEILS